MSEPTDRFCDVLRGMRDDDAKAVVSFGHMLCLGGSSSDLFLPDIANLRSRMLALVEEGVSEEFIVVSLFSYLIEHFRKWVDEDSVEESIDANLGLLEDLRADLLRSPDKRRMKLSDYDLRDLIEKTVGVVPRKHAQREQGRRIISHLETERAAHFDAAFWRSWRLSKVR